MIEANQSVQFNLSLVNGSASTVNHACQESEYLLPLERPLFLYIYPIILFICVLGNSANLVVYRHRFLRASPTIALLAAKAIANTLCIVSLLPRFAHSLPASIKLESVEMLYWKALPVTLFLINLFGTIAIWITVVVTVESYIMVAFPTKAKGWCSMHNAVISIVGCAICAIGLQVFYLISRRVVSVVCSESKVTHYYLVASGNPTYEVFYYWCNSVSTLLVPMVIMLVLTVLIGYLLFWSRSQFRQQGSEQKRCVTLLSMVTTACHLVFEMPHVANFMVIAIDGSSNGTWKQSFPWQEFAALANFLSMLDASLTFFVYFACSRRFRQIWYCTFCASCRHGNSATNLLDKEGNTNANRCLESMNLTVNCTLAAD